MKLTSWRPATSACEFKFHILHILHIRHIADIYIVSAWKRTARHPRMWLWLVLDSKTSSSICSGFFLSLAWNRTMLSWMKLLRWRLEIGISNWAAVTWPWHKRTTFLHAEHFLNVFLLFLRRSVYLRVGNESEEEMPDPDEDSLLLMPGRHESVWSA